MMMMMSSFPNKAGRRREGRKEDRAVLILLLFVRIHVLQLWDMILRVIFDNHLQNDRITF